MVAIEEDTGSELQPQRPLWGLPCMKQVVFFDWMNALINQWANKYRAYSRLRSPVLTTCTSASDSIRAWLIWGTYGKILHLSLLNYVTSASQSSNMVRSFWVLIRSFYVLSSLLNIMPSVDFSCVPSKYSSEYLSKVYFAHIHIKYS